MKIAYVDSSCLVAIAFGEPGSTSLASRLRSFERLFSSNLLEAELRSALAREGVRDSPEPLLSGISWLLPSRPLSPELQRVLAVGRLRGADLWHLACALFLDPGPSELVFLTLDKHQGAAAAGLGFAV